MAGTPKPSVGGDFGFGLALDDCATLLGIRSVVLHQVARADLHANNLGEFPGIETGFELDTFADPQHHRRIFVLEHAAEMIDHRFDHGRGELALLESDHDGIFAFTDFHAHALEAGALLVAELVDNAEYLVGGIQQGAWGLEVSRAIVVDLDRIVATGQDFESLSLGGFAGFGVDQQGQRFRGDLERFVVVLTVDRIGAIERVAHMRRRRGFQSDLAPIAGRVDFVPDLDIGNPAHRIG